MAEELSRGEETIEIVEEEPVPEPTISTEAIDNATNELMDLFEVVAGIDLNTGEKIEPPVVEEPIPLPLSYADALKGSQKYMMKVGCQSLFQQKQKNKLQLLKYY